MSAHTSAQRPLWAPILGTGTDRQVAGEEGEWGKVLAALGALGLM